VKMALSMAAAQWNQCGNGNAGEAMAMAAQSGIE